MYIQLRFKLVRIFCGALVLTWTLISLAANSVSMQPLAPAVVKPVPLKPAVIKPAPLLQAKIRPAVLGGICNVGVAGMLNFGSVDTTTPENKDIGGAKLVVTCSANVHGRVILSLGSGYSNRGRVLLSQEQNKLYYNVYLDVARNVIFGDGTRGTVSVRFGPPFPVFIPVFGRLFGSQSNDGSTYAASLPTSLKRYNTLLQPSSPAMLKIKK